MSAPLEFQVNGPAARLVLRVDGKTFRLTTRDDYERVGRRVFAPQFSAIADGGPGEVYVAIPRMPRKPSGLGEALRRTRRPPLAMIAIEGLWPERFYVRKSAGVQGGRAEFWLVSPLWRLEAVASGRQPWFSRPAS